MRLIDITTLRIPSNLVLIKPDLNFDTYQIKGRETGLHVAPWGINQASHISVTGTVYKVPEKLIYLGKQVKSMRAEIKKDVHVEIDDLRKKPEENKLLPVLRSQSMAYDVPMELEVGQKVYYEYTTRLSALKEGRLIDTSEGEMMLVPYDILIMAFKFGTDMANVTPGDVKMLNGYILIKPLEYALECDLSGVRGVRTEMDLFRPVSDEEKYVRFNNVGFANVIVAGCKVNDYIDFDKARPDDMIIGRTGQRIAYDNRMQKRLEVEHHHVIFKDHILYRMHRKDVMLWYVNGKINFFKTAI